MLLHDIQARTVEALPNLLHELKRRGYHIVHVTPATPERPKTVTEPSQWIAPAHKRQIGAGSFIEAVLPLPSQTSFGSNPPLDGPAVAAPIQQRGRPVLRPVQVPQPSDAVWPRGFSGSQAVLATTHSPLPATNPAVSYPETSFAPSLQGNTSLIVPPEPDAMASAPLESGAPADSAAPQSPATPLLAPRDPASTAPPLLTPRDLVSTAKMPYGPFP
jgi:hypothetical protein